MKKLYHYTSLHGLLGILSTQSLWSTDVRFLNDQREFSHGLEFAKDFATQIYMEEDYLERFGFAIREAVENLHPENLFVTSFSEKPDLLSQWRGYCPSGGGICLGFSFEKIQEFCAKRGYRLEQCTYEHNVHAQQVGALINSCFDKFPAQEITREEFHKLDIDRQLDAGFAYRELLSQSPHKENAAEALSWLCEEISETVSSFKDEGFHEEAEWRLIARNPIEQSKFRTSGSGSYLIPFIELEILKETKGTALEEIIVGPNPNQSRCSLSVRQLLAARRLHHVEVNLSKIPFNNW